MHILTCICRPGVSRSTPHSSSSFDSRVSVWQKDGIRK